MEDFYYQLVDAKGNPVSTVDAVSLENNRKVFHLRTAVWNEWSTDPLLSDWKAVKAGRLLVYANEAAFKNKEAPLKPGKILKSVLEEAKDNSDDNPILIVVPERVQPTTIQPPQTEPYSPCEVPFFNGIREAAERDGWISFGQDIPSTLLNRLYIRECYRTIAPAIKPGINKVIITGTPGIGKSLFLIYLLWKLVKQQKRVLFIYHPSIIYYDGKGGVFEVDRVPSNIDHSFWNDTLWCLFDAKAKEERDLNALPYSLCTFVLSTSPRRAMVNDFRKPLIPQKFYMPIWSKAEVEVIAPLFPNANKWRDRLEILGGIPRLVLEDTEQDPTKMLEAACTDCTLDDCIKKIGLDSENTAKSKVVHRLVHVISTSPYTESSVDYASSTALDIIVRIKGDKARRRMQELLAASEGHPHITALCGYVFEPYAIELLAKGGDFTYRRLVGGKEKKDVPKQETLTIVSSTKKTVETVKDGLEPNQLYVPKSRSFTAIDAWIPGVGAFQMTVGKTHPFKVLKDQQKKALKEQQIKVPEDHQDEEPEDHQDEVPEQRQIKLPRTEKILGYAEADLGLLGQGARFFWVLPPLYYADFTKKTPQTIDQYALLIPYPYTTR